MHETNIVYYTEGCEDIGFAFAAAPMRGRVLLLTPTGIWTNLSYETSVDWHAFLIKVSTCWKLGFDAGIVINRKTSEISDKEDGRNVYIKLYLTLKVFYKYK